MSRPNGELLALQAYVRSTLGKKTLGTNTLAYSAAATATEKKVLKRLTYARSIYGEMPPIKLFKAVIVAVL